MFNTTDYAWLLSLTTCTYLCVVYWFVYSFVYSNLLLCISTSPEQIAQQLEGCFKHLQNLEGLQSTIPPGVAEVKKMPIICTDAHCINDKIWIYSS